MSKENKSLVDSKNEIAKLRKQSERLEKLLKASCSHHNKKGLTLTDGIGEGNFVCTECGEEFNIAPISAKDLMYSVNVVHNAIQQLRAYADNEADAEIIKIFGETDYNINNLLEPLYKNLILNYKNGKKKNKKKKHRDNDNFGGYGGYSSLRR